MALTTAQQVRLKIQDPPVIADDVYHGDGRRSAYQMPHRNLSSGSAYVYAGPTAWSATGATFDASGFVTFSGAIPENTAFRARYVHTTFSDDEIGHFTAVGGNVLGAAVEAVEALMFDSLKRARWASPDGMSYDDTQAQNMLLRMHEKLQAERADDAVGQGGVQSWALNQENY